MTKTSDVQPPHADQDPARRPSPCPRCSTPTRRARRPTSSRSATSARAPARSPASPRPTTTSSNRCAASCRRASQNDGKTYQVEIIAKDSQSSGNRAAEVAVRADPRGQGRPAGRRRHARHHQSGVRPGRGQRDALHHHQLPVAAVLLRPQGRSGQGLQLDLPSSSGASRTSSPPSSRCGTARRPTRWSAACSPTTPTATPGATRSAACRRRSPPPATSCIDPGRYQVMNNDFSSQIAAFKAAECRDRHRQHDPAGLRDLLVAGGAAGLQAEDRHHRQGAAVPLGDRLARRARQRAHLRDLVDAEPSVQVEPHRPELRRSWPTAYVAATKRPWTQPIGFQHALFEVAIDVLKRAKAIEPKAILDVDRRRPTTSRSSARCNGPASR